MGGGRFAWGSLVAGVGAAGPEPRCASAITPMGIVPSTLDGRVSLRAVHSGALGGGASFAKGGLGGGEFQEPATVGSIRWRTRGACPSEWLPSHPNSGMHRGACGAGGGGDRMEGFRKGGGPLLVHSKGGKSELHRARCHATPGRPGIRMGDGAARPLDGQCHREHTAELRSSGRGGKGEKVG